MLKSLALVFSLIVSVTGFAEHHHVENPNLPTAWHEFTIFGNQNVYLSHLPMFHSIHDYQVIVQVKLDKVSYEKFAAHPSSHLTLSPTKKGATGATLEDRLEDWKLPNYMKAGVSFNGEIHWDAKTLAKDVTVTVEKVIHFKQFKDAERTPKELIYILFGTPEEAFLAHRMVKYPDFDQILAVELETEVDSLPESLKRPTEEYIVLGPIFHFPGTNNLPTKTAKGALKWEPLEVGKTVTAVSEYGDKNLELRIRREIKLNDDISRQY